MRTGARFRKDVEVWWLNFKALDDSKKKGTIDQQIFGSVM